MEAVLKKTPNGLIPDYTEAKELFDKIPDGSYALVKYVKKRNYENHKRFFKFIDAAFDNQDFYDEKEPLRKALIMLAGWYDELIIINKAGEPETHYIPKSISFDQMDEIEFRDLFTKCITAFLKRYGNGISREQFERIIGFD